MKKRDKRTGMKSEDVPVQSFESTDFTLSPLCRTLKQTALRKNSEDYWKASPQK